MGQLAVKTLHVVNWYPNPLDNIEGHFIKDQIDALDAFIPTEVLFIQVRYGRPKLMSYMMSQRERIWIMQVPVKSWFVIEIISSVALWFFFRFKYDLSKFRIINFHIAYPILTYFHLFKKKIKVPLVITEHWSAYHFNFGVSKELKRIKRIFSHGIPVITVSSSLVHDITRFSSQKLTTFQLPNVVNQNIFKNVGSTFPPDLKFFMLACWQHPKVPLVILEALNELALGGYSFSLRIGGYGPYEAELRAKIRSLRLDKYASFIGKLTFEQAAQEMQNCSFFLHASNYETFSLVCAEALSCGTPVIASAVGGIPEYLKSDNGILVLDNSVNAWTLALKKSFKTKFDRRFIAQKASMLFSANSVGMHYKRILDGISNDKI